MYKDMLDVTSVSFGMIELHDKNYLNDTAAESEYAGEGEVEKHSYFTEEGVENVDETMVERYKRWQTEQPHFVTK